MHFKLLNWKISVKKNKALIEFKIISDVSTIVSPSSVYKKLKTNIPVY